MANLGGLSMRKGLPRIPYYTKQNRMRNYYYGMKTRNTGLLSMSGTLNNNV